MKLKSTGPQV